MFRLFFVLIVLGLSMQMPAHSLTQELPQNGDELECENSPNAPYCP